MIVLGLDTCLSACSVAVLRDREVLAFASEAMARGHQERLAPMAREAMAKAGLSFPDLQRIGVTVGPGSFTGLRVGLAFAKGLASALSVPGVGVGALEALAAEVPITEEGGLTFAAIDARRGQVYVQAFEMGKALMAPDVLAVETAMARVVEIAQGRPASFVGSGAPLLAEGAPGARLILAEGCDARRVAEIAATRAPGRLAPLYLRAPDAKLPGGIAA